MILLKAPKTGEEVEVVPELPHVKIELKDGYSTPPLLETVEFKLDCEMTPILEFICGVDKINWKPFASKYDVPTEIFEPMINRVKILINALDRRKPNV